MLPFAREQLLLSPQAAGHVPPSSQGLEASAENPKDEVAPGSSMAEGRWALLQVSSHLLEESTARGRNPGASHSQQGPEVGPAE